MKIGRLLLRLAVGGFLFGHGTQKLFGWFGGHGLEATGGFRSAPVVYCVHNENWTTSPAPRCRRFLVRTRNPKAVWLVRRPRSGSHRRIPICPGSLLCAQ